MNFIADIVYESLCRRRIQVLILVLSTIKQFVIFQDRIGNVAFIKTILNSSLILLLIDDRKDYLLIN